MTYRGGAALSWQSDFSQFYLVDSNDPRFEAPVNITEEMQKKRWQRLSTGLVVYTRDWLMQVIEIRIFAAPRHFLLQFGEIGLHFVEFSQGFVCGLFRRCAYLLAFRCFACNFFSNTFYCVNLCAHFLRQLFNVFHIGFLVEFEERF